MILPFIISFFLYTIPFTFHSLWWLIFFFPFPFFYFVSQKRITFFSGTAWGIAFFATDMYGLKSTISTIANCCLDSAFLLAYAPGLYLCTITGLIFCTTETYISYFFPKKNRASEQLLSMWCIALFLLFIFIQNHALIIFFKKGGYPLINPLIPLINNDFFIAWLSIIPTPIALLFFFMTSLSLYLLGKKRSISNIYIMICLLFWGTIGLFFPPTINTNRFLDAYANSIIVVPRTINHQPSPQITINIISELCFDISDQHPSVTCILFPESALYDDFSAYSHIEEWSESYLGKKIHLIFGGFRKDKEWKRNCLYHFYNGTLQTITHKTHAIPIIEEQPTLFSWLGLYKNLSSHIAPDIKQASPLIINNLSLAPYLCSELLSLCNPYDNGKNFPILALCNNRYCPPFFQNKVKNLAKFRSITWQRDIFYIDYAHSTLFHKSGHSIVITNFFIDSL